MKKKVMIILTILGLAAVGLGIFMLIKPYRIYPGDRIKGTISATVNGKPVELTEENFRCFDSASSDKVKVTGGEKAEFSLKAGKYGSYHVGVSVPGVGDELVVEVFQDNWWNVSKADLSVEIDTNADTISWTVKSTLLDDDGKKHTASDHKDGQLSDASARNIRIG